MPSPCYWKAYHCYQGKYKRGSDFTRNYKAVFLSNPCVRSPSSRHTLTETGRRKPHTACFPSNTQHFLFFFFGHHCLCDNFKAYRISPCQNRHWWEKHNNKAGPLKFPAVVENQWQRRQNSEEILANPVWTVDWGQQATPSQSLHFNAVNVVNKLDAAFLR